MSCLSSANVLGGIGSPSGVRKSSRRSAAFFSLGLKPRMPSRLNAAFIRLTIRVCSPTRLSRSRLGRFEMKIALAAHGNLWNETHPTQQLDSCHLIILPKDG